MVSRRDFIGRAALLVLGTRQLRWPLPARVWPKHPDPRPGITAEHVLPVEKLPAKKKNVLDAFEAARTYPEIFDGLDCACECREPMNHRSLLSCYESEQPIGCWGCKEQANFVAPLAKEGKTLAEIREAVNKKFG